MERSARCPAVERECEHALAALASRSHALLAPRATTALVALLRALDLPGGSEVLMPVMLCANPVHAARLAGLRPVFADISPTTFNLDLDAAERLVGPQTRVLLAVPLFGHPLDVPAVLRFAERHGLIVIEDAAQAAGLRYETQPAGSLGLCSVYSFGPGKIADAGGGAALLSDDPTLLERVRRELAAMPLGRRDLDHADHILAALRRLPDELEARSRMAAHYHANLQLPGVTHPQVTPGTPLCKYSVLAPDRRERDRLTRTLIASGVAATNLYPPLPDFFPSPPRLAGLSYPVARHVHTRIINLSLWPERTPLPLWERGMSVAGA